MGSPYRSCARSGQCRLVGAASLGRMWREPMSKGEVLAGIMRKCKTPGALSAFGWPFLWHWIGW